MPFFGMRFSWWILLFSTRFDKVRQITPKVPTKPALFCLTAFVESRNSSTGGFPYPGKSFGLPSRLPLPRTGSFFPVNMEIRIFM